ncbi:hypothetical protein NIES4072_68940 [Nostoc commune NIES-4072]|uniref:Uncharacterized protein n=2 Tax=Nostoc commune TaxID=1178 RepID=A0A2R5FWP5_NOSCO|nr:hypothetical protein NIES4070_69380 [Nostoc commune HK-02]GBG23182.1 hypothetical protein NIES4072_68940 [Nostoc commune NIES-4072]
MLALNIDTTCSFLFIIEISCSVPQRLNYQLRRNCELRIANCELEMTYGVGNTQNTLPTNYDVYRQVVKAYPQRTPLELTLGVNDNSVEKAEPVSK